MAQLLITKHSKKYGFKKGETYDVIKTNTEYIIIMPDDKPNLTCNDKTLKRYGTLKK